MVAVALDHTAGILKAGLSPDLPASDMLPAWDLLEDQQPHFITRIKKAGILRVMAGSYQIHPQLLEQQGIMALQAWRGRIPKIRVVLMAVQTDKRQLPSVEIKPVGFEFRMPAAETNDSFLRICKRHTNRI